MIEILQYLYKYVPVIEREQEMLIPSQDKSITTIDTVQHMLIFGGNQLTAAHVAKRCSIGHRVETRSGHPGHIFSGLSGSDPLYKISRSDPD